MSNAVYITDYFATPNERFRDKLPNWLPISVAMYLAYAEFDVPIKTIAGLFNVDPSTVAGCVRSIQARREDPLVAKGMKYFGQFYENTNSILEGDTRVNIQASPSSQMLRTKEVDLEILDVLRHMAEKNTVLALAKGLELAVVVREYEDERLEKIATLARTDVMTMTLKDWIECEDPHAKIVRYSISSLGRLKLRRMATDADFTGQHSSPPNPNHGSLTGYDAEKQNFRVRYGSVESPLLAMARRKTKTGDDFLPKNLVAAGEQLREDYEIALIHHPDGTNWTDVIRTGQLPNDIDDAASLRVLDALADLGPGLGDVVYYCCCKLIGLEVMEKKMGWSARSGKIVMRIALQRLRRYYAENDQDNKMIG